MEINDLNIQQLFVPTQTANCAGFSDLLAVPAVFLINHPVNLPT